MRRDQKLLLVLAAIFFLPLIISWAWYLNVDKLRPEGSVAKGDLVEPVRMLENFELVRVYGGGTLTLEDLRGRWTLVYFGGPECDELCRETLYETRQVRTALGRDAVRVQRVYLLAGVADPVDTELFTETHRGMIVARVPADSPLHDAFRLGEVPAAGAARVYIIDPLGNLMMSYPAEASGRDLMDDLKRLFRVSRIG